MPISGTFYTSAELQQLLGVSRQRITNIATEQQWHSPFPGLYDDADVTPYLEARQRTELVRQLRGGGDGTGGSLVWDDSWDFECPVCGAYAVQEPPTDASEREWPWVCEQGHKSQ